MLGSLRPWQAFVSHSSNEKLYYGLRRPLPRYQVKRRKEAVDICCFNKTQTWTAA